MAITQELTRLGASARRLNDDSEQLNHLIAAIDGLLGRLMIGLDYVLPRPLRESVSYDRNGKRVIELSYLGYLKVKGRYGLVLKVIKVFENKLATAGEAPGDVVPLLQTPRRLRYAAVDLMPELVAGLSEQVEDVVVSMDRRRNIAQSLVHSLEKIAGPAPCDDVEAAAGSATTHRRQTLVALDQ